MLPSEFLLLAVIIVSTLTITKLTITAVTALEKHLSLRRKLIEEYSELSEWLDAYELCIDWSLNTFRSPDSNSIAKLDTTDKDQLVIEVSDLILKNIIPWHKELRMYIEGYSSTLELQDRIIDIIDNSKKI